MGRWADTKIGIDYHLAALPPEFTLHELWRQHPSYLVPLSKTLRWPGGRIRGRITQRKLLKKRIFYVDIMLSTKTMSWSWQFYEKFDEVRSGMQSFLDLHTYLRISLLEVMDIYDPCLLYLGVYIMASLTITNVILILSPFISKIFFWLKDLYKRFATSLDFIYINITFEDILFQAIVLGPWFATFIVFIVTRSDTRPLYIIVISLVLIVSVWFNNDAQIYTNSADGIYMIFYSVFYSVFMSFCPVFVLTCVCSFLYPVLLVISG
jgi:hypothetical protein